MKNKLILLGNKVLKIILPLIVILSIWEIAAWKIGDNFFLPRVGETFKYLVEEVLSDSFFKTVFASLLRVLVGLFLGIFFGTLFATICFKIGLLNTVFEPIISIMKATPVACIIALLWISFNPTQVAVLVVTLMVTPIIWQNVYEGYKSVDRQYIALCDSFGLGAVRRFKELYAPHALSYLLPAIVTSIGLAWKAEVAMEIMMENNVGMFIKEAKTSYETAPTFAWTAVIITLSIILEKTAKYFFGRIANELEIN